AARRVAGPWSLVEPHELDLGLEPDPRGLEHLLLDQTDQGPDVGGRGIGAGDEEVGVLPGDADSSDAEALQPQFVDDLPGRSPLGVLEDAPGVEGPARLVLPAPAGDLPDEPQGLPGIAGLGAEQGLLHEMVRRHVGVAVTQVEVVGVGSEPPPGPEVDEVGADQTVPGLDAEAPG